MKLSKLFGSAAIVSTVLAGGALVALASHSWGGYHWARTTGSFELKLGDNLTAAWDPYLAQASSDWSLSSVLDTAVVSGATNPKNCRAKLGRVEVCNSKYGNNGWLGIASIWASGDHIVQGTVKMNDTYFNTAKYNKPAWKNLVLCQEVGHTFGLDHQDEIFDNANLGTCMDYTSDPDGSLFSQLDNQHPNLHDYEMLESLYAHLDSTTTVSQTVSQRGGQEVDHSDPSSWGKLISGTSGSKVGLYEHDFGNGEKLFTFVVWAD